MGMKKLVSILLTVVLCIMLLPSVAVHTYAMSESEFNSKVNSFLADSRWKDGALWGYSTTPKISSWSSSGCCAYCADFAKYVYGKDSPKSGTAFTSVNDIKAGDILYMTNTNDGIDHWIAVLSRSGNNLRVAEGNYLPEKKCSMCCKSILQI